MRSDGCPVVPLAQESNGTVMTGADLARLANSDNLALLDCRLGGRRLRGASRVRLPEVLQRRLKTGGQLPLGSISPRLSRDKAVVIVPDSVSPNSLSSLLSRSLTARGYSVSILSDDVDIMLSEHPDLSESSSEDEDGGVGLSLDKLRLSSTKGINESDTATIAIQFPVPVLPFLYLGNAQTAGDRACLDRHGIRYVINVTVTEPNHFESDLIMHYLRIPVHDTVSGEIAAYFDRAFEFIEEARRNDNDGAVLVHCVAGISRSVTVTLAYLMRKLGKSLEQAFDLLLASSPHIAPNFSFMGQLLELERQLQQDSR